MVSQVLELNSYRRGTRVDAEDAGLARLVPEGREVIAAIGAGTFSPNGRAISDRMIRFGDSY